MGFMTNRFIAENRLVARLIIKNAKATNSSTIALLLDSQKAYDRIHPDYLHQTLQLFAFPLPFINCITALFFNTQIAININGHISNEACIKVI